MLRPGLTAVVIIAMLAWAGHSLARLFWLFNPQQPSGVAESVLSAASPAQSNATPLHNVDLAYLQENFQLSNGRRGSAQGVVAGEVSEAANTRLSLVLRGAVAGNQPGGSSAIIASGDQQRVYAIGDELQFTTPGVMLDSIHTNHVVLNNNGRLESLWMYQPQDSATTSQTSAVNAGTQRSEASARRQTTSAPSSARVQIRVYRENGSVRGFQIREDSDTAILAAAGLQAGDIITSVDGTTINQGNDLDTLRRQLEGRDRINLELTRNNAPMTVTVSRDAFAF